MARKRSRATTTVLPVAVDDFKLIRGIGPAIERHLHDAGIFTFAQLAALSPAEAAALVAGSSAKRIAKQNWIGQARKLAAPTASHQHYATFTVELLLAENNDVRRMRVVHVQDGDEDAWAGWDDTRLVNFFIKHAAIHPKTTRPAASREMSGSELRLEVGDLRLAEVSDEQLLTKRLRAKIDFQLSRAPVSWMGADPLRCFIEILACALASGETTLLAAARQPLRPDLLSYIATLEFAPPRIGRYQLAATILIPDCQIAGVTLGPVLSVIP